MANNNQKYNFPIIIKWIGYNHPMTTIIKNSNYDVDKYLQGIEDDVFCELISIEHYETEEQSE